MIVPLARRFDEVIPALQAHDMMVSRSGGLGELDRQEDTAPLRARYMRFLPKVTPVP